MATRAAPHVHGPSKHVYYNVLCVLLLLLCVVLCLAHALGHCVRCVCACAHWGLSARAVVTGHSLCLARGQHTFDVFIVLKIRGVVYGKKFFLKEQNTLRWSKLPLNRFQISEDDPHYPTPSFGKIQKTGPIPYPIVG